MEEQEKSDSNKTEKKIQKKSQKDMNGLIGGFVFGLLLTFVAFQIYNKFIEFPIGQIMVYAIGACAFICFMVSVSCFFDYKESKKMEKLDEDARREEKEFSQIDPEKRALRAEKMFRMNQKELMRYYDMNLTQTKFLSGLGIMMIIFGILIVVASLYLYTSLNSDKVLLFVGSLSGIVVDFIGAIFIKMYTKNIEAAVKFHAKFAESNNLLLANSIANKIDDDKLREETLSEISKNIIFTKKSTMD
ncbi:TRADD-N-associated membrane domain-containing protein [Frisingicoccus sp.]|uniref:TRADD-N-associated membrane domain-containing protein n=1 Tax=Frisingicoccus sp. TaxID=1918627 RepID=UPI003AB8D716